MKKTLSLFNVLFLLSSFMVFNPHLAEAAATPSCSLGGDFNPFIGENAAIDVNFSNTGADVGYAPFTELILPADTTFQGASYLGLTVSPVGGIVVVTDNDGGDPLKGEVTNPITGNTFLLDVGSTYVPLRYPLGSYTPTQGTATMKVLVGVNNGVAPNVALVPNFQARCGFELGQDPLDNPGGDPPIVSGFSASPITPQIIKNTKSFVTTSAGQERETATGPNFPIIYTLGVDVANGETVTGVRVSDSLASELVLTEVTSVNDGGHGFTITYTPLTGAPQVSTTVPFVIATPSAGGSLSVVLNSITGTTTANDGNIVYSAYIADTDSSAANVLDPNTPNPTKTVSNTVSTQATHNALLVNAPPVQSDVIAKAIALQKSSTIAINVGDADYSPGDTVRYSVGFQVSDYFSFDTFTIEDILPDGVLYVDGSASLSVLEDGVTQTPTFTETDVTEAVFTGGVPYNFATDCAGCSLAVMEDLTNNDDAVTTPGDGQTRLLFDVSNILTDGELVGGLIGGTPVGQPTTVTLTYDVVIQESFIDGVPQDQSIDATDVFVNNAKTSFDLTSGTGGFGTDDSSSSFSIVPPTFSKEMTAVIDGGNLDVKPFVTDPARVNPGGGVVFSLSVDIPSGDLEDLIITDFLPIPFFDATQVSVFDVNTTNTPYVPTEGVLTSVPVAGTIGYGSGTTGMATPYPTPVITSNAADNTLAINFTDNSTFEHNPSNPISIELLFQVSTTNDAFASGLNLVNVASFDGANSHGSIDIGTGIVNMVTGGPHIKTRKGVVDSSATGAVYTPTTVGPVPFDGTNNPVFTGVITTENLATNAVGSSIDEVDAADRVTFAAVFENDGTIPAFDIIFTDSLPTGFIPPTNAANLNLHIYDGGGTDLGSQTTGGLFGQPVQGGTTNGTNTSVSFIPTYSLPPYDRVGSYQTGSGLANQGDNILVITYDLYPDETVNINTKPKNTVTLTQYAGTTGGGNYALNPAKNQASAGVSFVEPIFTKSAGIHPTLDLPDTTFPDVTIGEVTQYKLAITVPEGTITGAKIVDNIPNGLAYYMTNGVTVDTSATCSGTAFAGTIPSFSITPTGVGAAGNGVDLTVDFNGDIVTTADNNSANNTFCLVYDAVVTDVLEITDNTSLSNSATLTYGTNGSVGPQTSNINARAGILQINKAVSPTTGGAGDVLNYTITVDHATGSTFPVFDVEVTDQIQPGITLNTNFSSDGLDNDGDGLIDGADGDELDGAAAPFYDGTDTFTFNATNNPNNGGTNAFNKVSGGESIVMKFSATSHSGISPGQNVPNKADLQYDSYPGTPPPNITGRTVNTFDIANFTVAQITAGKSVTGTSFTETGTSQFNGSFEDIAVGETVTYTIPLGIPASTFTNLVVQDTLHTGFRVTNATLQSVDAGIVLTPSAPNIVFNNNTATYNLGNVTATSAGNITLLLEAVVTDSVPAGTNYTNTISTNFTENTGAAITATADVDVVKPFLNFAKNVDTMNGDAGDSFVFTIDVDNVGSGPAFDIAITDIVPAGFTIDTPGADGLDNDGDGAIDEADEGVANFLSGSNFSWNRTTAGTHFDTLNAGSSFQIKYRATIAGGATLGSTLTNNANISYDSAPGVNADQQTFTGSSNAAVSVNLGNLTKILDSSITDKNIGETVPYKITVTVPEGTVDDLEVTDILPAGLALVPGTVVLTSNSASLTITHNSPVITANPTSTAITAGQSQNIKFDLGQVINSNVDNTVDETFDIQYQAVVLNTTDNASGGTHVNQASVDFGGLGHAGPISATPIRVIDPILSVGKSSTYVQGDTATYTIEIENNALSATGIAHDVVVTDTIPAGMSYAAGEVFTHVPGTPTIDISGLPTVVYTFPTIPETFNSGNPLVFSYNVTLPLTTAEGSVLTNSVSVAATSAAGTTPYIIPGNTNSGERSYTTTGNTPLTVKRPNLSTSNKSVVDLNGGEPESGDVLEYTINIINTGNTPATGIQVTDHMPIHVDNFTITSLPASGINNSQSAPNGNNNTGLLQFDSIAIGAAGSANDRVQIVYRVTVATGAPDGITIQNNMVVSPAAEGGSGGADTETIGLDFPVLNLQKSVNASNVIGGQSTVTYTLDISNTGTGDSLNTVITDLLANGLVYVPGSLMLDGNPLTDIVDGDQGDFGNTDANTMRVVLPNLVKGGAAQITFKATVNVVSSMTVVSNTAMVADDQGSNSSAQALLTVNPIPPVVTAPSVSSVSHSSGGGGGGGGSRCYNCGKDSLNINTFVKTEKLNKKKKTLTTKTEKPNKEKKEVATEIPKAEKKEDKNPLMCEDIQLKRISDNFIYTNKIPLTGPIPRWLRDHYDAYSVLPSVDQGHPYYQAALDLTYQRVIDNYHLGGDARMQDMLSRAEVAKIASIAGQLKIRRGKGCIKNPFADIRPGKWYEDYVLNLAQQGIINGYEDGLYHPLESVTLGEFSKIFVNTFKLDKELLPKNVNEYWAQPFYDVLVKKEIIPQELRGRPLNSKVSRSESFEMIRRLTRMVDSNENKYVHTITMSIPNLDLYDMNAQNTLLSDESVWLKTLTNAGLGYYYDSVNDNTIIFGHSSIWEGDPTPYGAVFKRAIDETQVGDIFYLVTDGVKHTYKIKTRDKVLGKDYEFIQEPADDIDAIWFTCDHDLDYRWVFKAEEVSTDESSK